MTDHSGETTPERHEFKRKWSGDQGDECWQSKGMDGLDIIRCGRRRLDPIHRCANCGEAWHPHRTEALRFWCFCAKGDPTGHLHEPSAGDAATDVDSTAEVCACGHDEAAHKNDDGDWTCCHRYSADEIRAVFRKFRWFNVTLFIAELEAQREIVAPSGTENEG